MSGWCPAGTISDLFPPAQSPDAITGEPRAWISGEDLLGIIPSLSKITGIFSSKTYTMLVTERRLIFAELLLSFA